VWGCPAEATIYNPNINKLDPKTVSCYFIGYPEKSKGYKVYATQHSPRIFETHQVKFLDEKIHNTSFEDLSSEFLEIMANEHTESILPIVHDTQAAISVPETPNAQDQLVDQEMQFADDQVNPEPLPDQPQPVEPQDQPAEPHQNQNPQLRRSNRARKPTYGGGRF
jgi:hypothetical protein